MSNSGATLHDPAPLSSDPLSLLIVNPMGGDGWGGVERWLTDVATGLVDRGHSVFVSGRPGSTWMKRSLAAGFPGLEVPLRGDFHLGQARKLKAFMRDNGVDVVATKLHRGIRAAGFAAKLAGAPPVVAFMGLVETRPGLKYRLTYELFLDRVVTLSEAMREEIVRRGALDPDVVAAIPYGVRAEDYVTPQGTRERVRETLGIPADAPFALALGRLNVQKRFDLLLEAFREVRRRVPNAQLAVAGTGKLAPDLEAQRSRLGLERCVHFLGFRRDVAELLTACDTLVLSSDDEGLPMVIFEAMACARAVLTTRVGSVAEQVEDGRTGLLYPRRDVAALTQALVRVLCDRKEAAAMGRAGLARVVATFPVARCVERTEQFLIAARDQWRATRVGSRA